jgi:hypothetical protein
MPIAHSHYTKALQHFRRGVTDFIDGKESNPLMLLVGALLMYQLQQQVTRKCQGYNLYQKGVDRRGAIGHAVGCCG